MEGPRKVPGNFRRGEFILNCEVRKLDILGKLSSERDFDTGRVWPWEKNFFEGVETA